MLKGVTDWLAFLGPFWSNYVAYFPFQFAHLLIGLLAIGWIVLARVQHAHLRPHILRTEPISPNEVDRYKAELSRFDGRLETCAATFILIGLVGTIYGFAAAVPRLHQETYRFEELSQALSTSALGIIWSVVLIVVKGVAVDRPAGRLLVHVRTRQMHDPLERSIPQLAAQLAGPFRESLEVFAKAAEGLTSAMSEFNASSTGAAQSFSKVAQQVGETAHKVDLVLQQTAGLPGALAARLNEVFDGTAIRLQELLEGLTRSATELLGISEGVATAIREASEAHIRQLESVLASYATSLEKLEAATAVSLAGLVERLDEAVTRHASAVASLQNAVTNAVREQLAELARGFKLYEQSVGKVQEGAVQALESIRSALQKAANSAGELPQVIAQRTVEATEACFEAFRSQQQAALEAIRRVASQAAEEQLRGLREVVGLFQKCVQELEKLPERVSQETLTATETYLARWKQDHEEAVKELRRVGTEVIQGQIQVIGKTATDLKRSAEELDRKFQAALEDRKRLVEEAVLASLNEVIRIVDGYRNGLQQISDSVPEEIRSAQERIIQSTADCADRVAKLSTEVCELTGTLPGTLAEFRQDVFLLDQATLKLREATQELARFWRPEIGEELIGTLKNLAATLDGLRGSLAQLERQSRRTTMWSWFRLRRDERGRR